MAVTVETLERGDGETYARTGERVDVFYVGMLPSGAVFDSTESDRLRRSAAVGTSSLEAEAEGETARTFDLRWHKALTFNIGLGHVIRGLEEGVAQMSLGERARLRIPAESAYGEKEFRDSNDKVVVPAGSDVIFEVELLRIWPVDGSFAKIAPRMKKKRMMDVLLAPVVPPQLRESCTIM